MQSLPSESWTFSVDDYAVQHQGLHVIDLQVDYDYRAGVGSNNPFEYPNFLPLAHFIEDFLVNYPNETDFWEIVNRKLVEGLLTEPVPTPYGSDYQLAETLDRLSITLTVHPDTKIPYLRSSTVEQDVFIGTDVKDKFEGGIYGDAIRGGDGNDILHGNGGSDYLSGGGDRDRLFGDDGSDTLVGDTGADRLTGGAGADHFVLLTAKDSTPSAPDKILDFSHAEGDLIDVSQIDAMLGTGNDAFTFVDAFNGKAGELKVKESGSDQYVQGDIDGDGRADLEIVVVAAARLMASDFIL